MIRDKKLWAQFEAALARQTPSDFDKNVMILEALYTEARNLGVFPLQDPLHDIETDIKVARVVNYVRSSS